MNQRVDRNSFGYLLLTHRTGRGLSQRGLSAGLREHGVEIGPSSITRMETGQREPSLSEALALSRYLGFDLIDVVSNEHLTFWGHRDAAQMALMDARAALARCFAEVRWTKLIYDNWDDDHTISRDSIGHPLSWLEEDPVLESYIGKATPPIQLTSRADDLLLQRVMSAVCRIDVERSEEWVDGADS